MRLTRTEIERGWVIHTCPAHGPLVACSPKATVLCGGSAGRGRRCNKKAAKVAWNAPQKPLQMKG